MLPGKFNPAPPATARPRTPQPPHAPRARQPPADAAAALDPARAFERVEADEGGDEEEKDVRAEAARL